MSRGAESSLECREALGVALIVDGEIRFANRRLGEMAGYTPGEARKMALAEFLVNEDRVRASTRIDELLGGGREHPSTYRLLRKDGSTTPVETFL